MIWIKKIKTLLDGASRQLFARMLQEFGCDQARPNGGLEKLRRIQQSCSVLISHQPASPTT
jgi:hypothetical protein